MFGTIQHLCFNLKVHDVTTEAFSFKMNRSSDEMGKKMDQINKNKYVVCIIYIHNRKREKAIKGCARVCLSTLMSRLQPSLPRKISKG